MHRLTVNMALWERICNEGDTVFSIKAYDDDDDDDDDCKNLFCCILTSLQETVVTK